MLRKTMVIAGAALAAGAGLWRTQAHADAEAVRSDPQAPLLDDLDVPGEQRWVTSTDGTRLNVELHGPEGAPVVVFAHGWTCSTRYWIPQVRALADTYRVVTYDQRGHGASGSSRGRFTPELLAADLEAVLENVLAPEEQAVLVGHSMGAMSIVAWAGQQPDQVSRRVRRVLLASTALDSLLTETAVVRLPSRFPRLAEAIGRGAVGIPTPFGPPSPLAYRAVKYVALSPSASPAQVAFCEEIVLSSRTRDRAKWGSALARLDLRESLTHLTVPTTVLVGTADRLTPPSHAKRLAEALKRDGHLDLLVQLPGVGHMSSVENVDAFNAEVRRLLEAEPAG
ncbi:alpha/beta hydrolase [Rhodococcus sp. X156]|uniref:alpha/beta fold hydrolase n=1 Tax=Rhodococcus sp. X156 TaxID=2499145 RepID=UPI001F49CF75|nr:alpha/beta hydrolase [Rhodococcus sp. X156]